MWWNKLMLALAPIAVAMSLLAAWLNFQMGNYPMLVVSLLLVAWNSHTTYRNWQKLK